MILPEGTLASRFGLPVRVLQFGTGRFLCGFADYFVEQANRAGILNGRVVAVGSTGSGRARLFNQQDGLFTLLVRGYDDGQVIEETHLITAVDRALASKDQWQEVLTYARHPALALAISNTTEVGLAYDPEDRINRDPPRSFPGKLTAVLYERAQAFDYDPSRGLIVLPCELLENNGDRLRNIVHQLAEQWALGPRFMRWLGSANYFCNTLVDRIVPGMPAAEQAEVHYQHLGYRDHLLTVAEPYRLWAIEGDAALQRRFPLAGVDKGIVLTEDLTPYRVRKVRMLNGTHTIMVPVALLCGLETVADAVEDARLGRYIRRVLLEEIVPSLGPLNYSALSPDAARAYAHEVLDRFANPSIRHKLLDITLQQTTKMGVRVVPSILGYVEATGTIPDALAFGFACFLLFQHPETGPPASERPADDAAGQVRTRWTHAGLADFSSLPETEVLRQFVATVCADKARWGADLGHIPGFIDTVSGHLTRAIRDGVPAALDAHLRADAD